MVSRVQPPGRGSSLYHMLEDSQAAIFCCCCEVPSPGCARRTASSSPPPTLRADDDSPASPPPSPASSSSSIPDAVAEPAVKSPDGSGGGTGHLSRPAKRPLSDMGAGQQQQQREGAGADAKRDRLYSPFRRSLFPGVPPTLQFYCDGHQVLPLPASIRRQLRWKVTSITPLLIRQTVVRSGFRLTRDGPYWNGTWGKHIKCFTFAEIKSFQKVNHFPGSFHLGRKDKLWQNVVRLGRIRGERGRPSLPDTFLLPQELPLLRDAWLSEEDHCWIIKPPASARGAGVHVVHRWDQIPKKQPLVVQRYVRNPYLINGTKFDLRLYALVTSFDPLKIYLFPDGLVRFASNKYSQESEDLCDRYMHLTNYSINKKSATYTPGGSGDCQGHKWSIRALQGYLEALGVDFASLWDQMENIVVKTLSCAEGPMNRLIQRHTSSRYTCYELFGFDILLDEQLKPWLLEVNISPSLRSATPVDHAVKSQVVKDMLNLVGFQLPQQLKDDLDERLLECYGEMLEEQDDLSLNPLLHTYSLSPAELFKHRHYETSLMDVEEETSGLLESLTPDDVRVLVQSEDEFCRRGSFERVFPGGRHGDATLLAHRRYYNLLLAAWERRFGHQRLKGVEWLQRLCSKGFHLMSPDTERVPTAESHSPVSEKSQRRKVTRNVNILSLQMERQHRG